MAFNQITLMGRLTADPELKNTQSGVAVTSFSLAVDRNYTKEGQEKQTDFITIVAWKNQAEFVCRYFNKGSAMLVSGELQIRPWTDNNGSKHYSAEVLAKEIRFCESKKNSEGNNTPTSQNGSQDEKYNPYAIENTQDDDLPF